MMNCIRIYTTVGMSMIVIFAYASHNYNVLITPEGNVVTTKKKRSAVLLQRNDDDSNDYSGSWDFYVGPRVKARYSLEEGIEVAIGRVKKKSKRLTVANVEVELQRMQDACDVYFGYTVGYTDSGRRVKMREVQTMIANELAAKHKCTVKNALADSEPRARYYSDRKKFVKVFVDFRYKEWSSGSSDPEFGAKRNQFKCRDIGLINRAKKAYAAEAEKLWKIDGGAEVDGAKKTAEGSVPKATVK